MVGCVGGCTPNEDVLLEGLFALVFVFDGKEGFEGGNV